MNILITGASGQVGYDLVKKFSNYAKILAIYRSKNHKTDLKHKNITWKKLDLSKTIQLRFKPDYIIHCAVAHEFSQLNKERDFLNSNVLSIINLIDFIKKKKIKLKNFINLSTFSVYEESKKIKIIDENSNINNKSLLSLTKSLSELLIVNSGLNYINVRLPGVLTGSNNHTRPWLKTIINKIKNNEEIYISNINKEFNSIIDTTEIFIFLKKIFDSKMCNENFNLSASQPIKINKIIKILMNKYNSHSKLIKINNSKNSIIYKNKKIIEKLNYYPASVEDILLRNIN